MADHFLIQADQLLDCIPSELTETLHEKGWTFYITTRRLADDFGGLYSSVAGYTNTGDKIICIENRKNAIDRSVIHEAGHAVDYELGWTSDTDEFLQIFEQEKSAFVSSVAIGAHHETANSQEFFASIWVEYIQNPENLLKYDPESYHGKAVVYDPAPLFAPDLMC